MNLRSTIALSLLCGVCVGASAVHALRDDAPKSWTPGGFTFEVGVTVPGAPADVFDAFTGDVLPWWDHHFSAQPKAMYIEPKPGGAFMEIFDAAGNGVQHARVTGVERGKMLRMVGPLGAAGMGADFEMTFTFEAEGDATKLLARVNGSGNVNDKLAAAVQGVWKHFLIEQFEPYVRSGKHETK